MPAACQTPEVPATAQTAGDAAASWSAVVLAGGRGARLGGVEKAALQVGGRTMLARALEAVAGAAEVVTVGPALVVGDAARGAGPTASVAEVPRHGGPVAGLLAGRHALTRPVRWLVVVAVDMPYLTPGTLRRLLRAAEGHDGSALHDPDGRRQLALALDLRRLDEVTPAPAERHGHPLHRLLAPLDLAAVASMADEHHDVDTWDDLQ